MLLTVLQPVRGVVKWCFLMTYVIQRENETAKLFLFITSLKFNESRLNSQEIISRPSLSVCRSCIRQFRSRDQRSMEARLKSGDACDSCLRGKI